MRSNRIFIAGLMLASCTFLGSARLADVAPQNPVLSSYFVVPKDEATMLQIAERFEVHHRHGDGYEVLVPVPEKAAFLKLAPNAELKEADIEAPLRNMTREDRAGFHSFETVKPHLDRINSAYPEMTTVDSYGKSMEGRPLNYLRLLTKNGAAKKPQIVISAATHGNELITVEVVFGILENLVADYGKNARITKIVDDHEIYFIPVINPDGYSRQQRYANGIDPNRDYPWPDKPNRKPNPAIQAIMDFYAARDIKGSIDYHSTGGMIMYPWAYTYDPIQGPDKSEFHELTRKMASHNNYAYGPISKVIYVAKGSSADYYYWKYKTKALGIEIRNDGSSSVIPSMLKENYESTLTFLEAF